MELSILLPIETAEYKSFLHHATVGDSIAIEYIMPKFPNREEGTSYFMLADVVSEDATPAWPRIAAKPRGSDQLGLFSCETGFLQGDHHHNTRVVPVTDSVLLAIEKQDVVSKIRALLLAAYSTISVAVDTEALLGFYKLLGAVPKEEIAVEQPDLFTKEKL